MWSNRHRAAALVLLALLLAAAVTPAAAYSVTLSYPASDTVLYNPYIGNAVWARDRSVHEQPFTLVYADLVWAEFEPEPGRYDFESFETKNQLERWRTAGKKLIFRFVLDVPGDKRHRDIPDWLYEATGGDGTDYSVSYGKGYSPDYTNPVLIEAHAAAIAALGEHYGDDPFFAYVQLGSLGHWGEWHVHQKLGEMPIETVRDQYVLPYIDAFDNAFLMMRRPFTITAEYGLGLFNDTAGEPRSTETWLGWIADGGDYESPDGTGALVQMPDVWQTAPIGGELSTSMSRESLLREHFAQTLSLFERSHTSWIGPGSFADVRLGGRDQAALDDILRLIGYRLRVTQCDIAEIGTGTLQATLSWTNDGTAPFYFDWQPALLVTDAVGNRTVLPLDLHLSDILPGQTVSVSTVFTHTDYAYRLWAGILDPSTNKPAVALAMDVNQSGLWYELMRLK